MIASGTIMLIMEARKTPFMIARVVIWPPIQSMVVVTSPIGLQAPPALAAITMMPAKNNRSSCLSSSFFISEIITMVVVRLSSTELRKKVTKPTSQIRVDCLVVLNSRGDHLETVVGIHHFHYCHGPHQKEDNLGSSHQ